MYTASACFYGVELTSCVKLYAVFDLAFGTIRSIIALSGLSNISYVPGFGSYALSWLISTVNSGLLSVLCGIIAAFALQTKSFRYMDRFWRLKSLQVFLAILGALVVLSNLKEVASETMEEYIKETVEEAAHSGIPPPAINRNELLPYFEDVVLNSAIISVITWLFLGLYGVYIGRSLFTLWKNGIDPSETHILVSLSPPDCDGYGGSLRLVTPQLQGQSPIIPVAF